MYLFGMDADGIFWNVKKNPLSVQIVKSEQKMAKVNCEKMKLLCRVGKVCKMVY